MSAATHPTIRASRNFQKHTNPNPLHRWLLHRFHQQVAKMVAKVLPDPCEDGRETRTGPAVLDVGCGEGFVAALLAQHFPSVHVLGADSRPEAIAFARQRGLARAGWMAADAFRLPLRDASVPVVLCLEVLEHLPQPWPALEELKRVCSGSLVMSVPSQPYFALANLLRGKNLRTLGEDPEHVSHWRSGTFLRLLGQRLAITEVAYAFPWMIAVGKPPTRPGG